MLIPLVAMLAITQDAPEQVPARVPTLVRLQIQNLRRAHEDAARYQAQRQPVALKTGLNDYRCVIHAHSYLSHDSRGTIAEIAAAAKQAGVAAVFLTNHPNPKVDVIQAGQRGEVDGVLFVAGAEANGFLIFPSGPKLPPLDVPEQQLVESVCEPGGVAFIAHPEEHKDWSLRGLTGMEIYNTHADFLDEKDLLAALKPTDSHDYGRLLGILNAIDAYPQEGFAAIFDPPAANLAHYDAISSGHGFAAVAANDSHQNTGFILRGAEGGKVDIEDPLGEKLGSIDAAQNPAIKLITGEPVPGKVLMRRVLDPYPVSFHYISTHVLARERTPAALQQALENGRTYVAFDWIADTTGTAFVARAGDRTWNIGDAVPKTPGLALHAELPLKAGIRLFHNGEEIYRLVSSTLEFPALEPGVYRLEAWLPIAGELRAWIYTGAIRVTE